jgi:pyridoxal phosphate enzyme (YggS family)
LNGALRAALAGVEERIQAACQRAGRDRQGVRLVAVSKGVPAERVREALDCGQRLFGENRVQEGLAKQPLVGAGAVWHLVGHLQRNKARHAVGAFELLHGVDSVEIVEELDRRAAAARCRQSILLQVNLAAERTKHGLQPAELPAMLERLLTLEHLLPAGLMALPPPVERAEQSRPWFASLRRLRDDAALRTGLPLAELSMGMSDDFEVAVEEGATLIRVGRAIFGER